MGQSVELQLLQFGHEGAEFLSMLMGFTGASFGSYRRATSGPGEEGQHPCALARLAVSW